jgi:hypothetical protein
VALIGVNAMEMVSAKLVVMCGALRPFAARRGDTACLWWRIQVKKDTFLPFCFEVLTFVISFRSR